MCLPLFYHFTGENGRVFVAPGGVRCYNKEKSRADVTVGIAGTAAAWHNLEGGASQYVFPLNGETLVELGIFTMNK